MYSIQNVSVFLNAIMLEKYVKMLDGGINGGIK